MEWIWLLAAAGAGIYFWQRSRASKLPAQPMDTPLGMNIASDRGLMLMTFRRELANYLIRVDADRFLRLYRKARQIDAAIEIADNENRKAQLIVITKRHPLYSDFDLFGTREHVLYADAMDMYSIEDIEEHYLILVEFHALQRTLDPNWRYRIPATSDKNEDHLNEYVRKMKDTKFRQRLIAATDEFFTRRQQNRLTDPEKNSLYETESLTVYSVPHIVENRYGFYFKDTNEYGLYGSFYDDEREKTYQNYYRSGRKFETEHHLEYLRIDAPI